VEHFVTCFDSYFLPQGLALYQSLRNQFDDFTLWVICLNETTADILASRNLPNMRLLKLGDLENQKLLSVKETRSRAEYIWTLSPFIPGWVFEADRLVNRVTYLDADLYFFNNPYRIYKEFEESGKAILITEHAYDKKYDQSFMLGKFCVQFIIYKRNESDDVTNWWADRCIEWCYGRWENGKYGDQKYLDEWPNLFPDKVHILTQLCSILAPWNSSRYPSSEFVAWHFHGFRLLKYRKVLFHTRYKISSIVEKEIYSRYLEIIRDNISNETYNSDNSVSYNLFKERILFIISALVKTILRFKMHSFNPRIKIGKL
jgi:hypothetical protein